jgi:hypothetical protein
MKDGDESVWFHERDTQRQRAANLAGMEERISEKRMSSGNKDDDRPSFLFDAMMVAVAAEERWTQSFLL